MLFRCEYLICLLLLFFQATCFAATCTSTTNGQWTNAGTWSCGSVPTCGDSVIIAATNAVTVTGVQDLRGCGSNIVIVIRGILRFTTSGRLRLPCNSRVYIFSGGSLVPLGDGGGSNELEICGNRQWRASDGTINGPACFPTTLSSCSAVLPVELASFGKITCSDANHVCLGWQTYTETNNALFELERSTNGYDFSLIEKIPSKAPGGNSKLKINYEATDKNPPNGTLYYRLKQIDLDLTSSNSGIIKVDSEKKETSSLAILPVPNNGNFTLIVRQHLAESADYFEVKNAAGLTVYKNTYTLMKGQNQMEIRIPEIPEGFYFCRLELNHTNLHAKFVVVK